MEQKIETSLSMLQESIHSKVLLCAESYRKLESELIDLLQEVDKHKVYLALGYPSLFVYVTDALNISEANAYAFVRVARKSLDVPELKAEIKKGNLSLSKAIRIVPVLSTANKSKWIEKASNLSKTELEKEVRREKPEEFKREFFRRMEEDRFLLKIGLSEALADRLKRAQNLESTRRRQNLTLEETLGSVLNFYLQRSDPLLNGKAKGPGSGITTKIADEVVKETDEVITDRVVKASGRLEDLKGGAVTENNRIVKKFVPGHKVTSKPQTALGVRSGRPRSALAEPLRRTVLRRDKSQCQFRGRDGRICGSQRFLEVHHIKPVSKGGQDIEANLISLCAAHHRFAHNLQGHAMPTPWVLSRKSGDAGR